MAVSAKVDGVELEVSRLWSRRPYITSGGKELPKDATGRYELRDRRGGVRRVDTTFDWREFGPRLRVGDADQLLGRPLPLWVRVGYLVLLVLGIGLGGALGGLVAGASAVGSAALLRQQDRPPSIVFAAALVPFAGVVIYLALATLLAR